MAVVIDELIVKLGLDPSEFTKGQAEAVESFKKTQDGAKKAASEMEADGKQAGRFYSNIKSEALSLIAVLVGAKDIAGFLKNTVTDLSAVGRIAAIMGVAAPDVMAVSMAVERLTGNGAAAKQSMLGLSQVMAGWKLNQLPSFQFRQAFGFIGGNVGDDPLTILQKFADFAEKAKGDPARVYKLGGELGLDPDLIQELMQGKRQFGTDLADSYKNGIPTDADIKKVQGLQKAFFELAQSLKFDGTELVVDVADPLTHILDLIIQFTHDFQGATKILLAFVAAATALKTLGFGGAVLRNLAGAPAVEATPVLGPLAGVAGGLLSEGMWSTPAGIAKIEQAIADPAHADDATLHAALAYAQQQNLTAPAQYKGAAAAQLERVAQEQLKRSGDPRTGRVGAETAEERARGGPGQPALPTGSNAPSFAPNATVRQRAALAEAYLQRGGFTAEQSRGIVAGLYAETAGTLSPDAKNPTSSARGLAQWLLPRQREFAEVMHKPLIGSSSGEQLQFIMYEFQHKQAGAAADIRRQGSASGAAAAFIHDFENPGLYGELVDNRSANRFLASEHGHGGIGQVGPITITVTSNKADPKAVAHHVGRELAKAIVANSNSSQN